jgi:hypothetical protein
MNHIPQHGIANVAGDGSRQAGYMLRAYGPDLGHQRTHISLAGS